MPKKRSGIRKDESRNTWLIDTRFTTPDGEVLYIKKRGFKTETDAFEYLEIFKAQKLKEFESQKRFYSWKEATDEFWNHYCTRIKRSSANNMRILYNSKIVRPYEDKSVEQVVKYKNIVEFKKNLISAPYTSAYKNRIIRYMYWTIEYLYNRGIVTVDEFKSCNLELETIVDKDEVKKEKQFWTIEEFEKFIDSFSDDDKYKVLFEVFGHLGCRLGEIRGLQVKHYNPSKKEIFICQQANSKLNLGKWEITTPKTKKSIRHVTVSDRIAALLDSYIKDMGYKADDFLFFGSSPVGEMTVRRVLDDHIAKAEVTKITVHGIRHSNATWLLNNPNLTMAEIGKISERLGHESKKVTLDIYYHLVKNVDDKNILSALL